MTKSACLRSCGECCAFGPFMLALARFAEGAEKPADSRLNINLKIAYRKTSIIHALYCLYEKFCSI